MNYYIIPFTFLFFSGLVVYSLNYKHFLIMLLSLEVVVVSLFLLIFFFCSVYSLEVFLSIIYLSLSVCEGALGLSLLVLLIRTHGNDSLFTFDLLW
uniref:NADH-ubiquinone oxidoreductase chain 4L n=1 Tax=Ips calligraphus TaxID=102827 RepID=A0A8B0KGX1_9CUCU|nr:NADH dehydrogenase subunit 4L [Ips calligraphus]QTV76825.1 NADH dehydrogenase subunit 4L [Ips calligraphus]